MQRTKIAGLALGAVFALSAIVSSEASAKPKPYPPLETYPALRVIEKGDPIYIISNDLKVQTKAGEVDCAVSTLTAQLDSNGLKTDIFTDLKNTFTGAGGGPCTGNIVLGNPTISGEPPAGGWEGTVGTNNHKTLLKGSPLMFTATFPAKPGTPPISCTWAASKIRSSFNGDGKPIKVTTANAKFKLASGDPVCPKSGKLSATWEVFTEEPASGDIVAVALG